MSGTVLKWFCAIVLGAAFAIACPTESEARRVALIIGNSNYRHVPELRNPGNDAAAVAALLKEARFDAVDVHQDLTLRAMRTALAAFVARAQEADIAVIYFAGHGIEAGGTNYLIPVDARLARDTDIEREAVALETVLRTVEPAKRLRLVILDPCRDNPFVKAMTQTTASRAIGQGLSAFEPTIGETLVAFSAKGGSTAQDGDAGNSPFSAATVKHVAIPGLDVRLAFGRVRDDVMADTQRQQEPFVYGTLGGSNIPLVDGPIERLNEQIAAMRAELASVQAARDRAIAQSPQDASAQRASSLRQQLAALEETLAVTKVKEKESQARIEELGARLNMALTASATPLSRYRSELFRGLQTALGNQPDIRVVGDRLVFQAERLFEPGSAALRPAARPDVEKLAVALNELERKIPPDVAWILRVDGHVDAGPGPIAPFRSKWELSSARAAAIVQALIQSRVAPNRLVAAGFGEFQPLDAEASDDGYRRNRRIELKLTER